MRPSILDPLFAPLTGLPGIGPKFAPLFEKLLGEPDRPARLIDLLFHAPRGGIDRRLRSTLRDAPIGETVTVDVLVEEYRPPPPGRARAPMKVLCSDETGDITLVFFKAAKGQVERMLPIGQRRWISGEIELFDGHRQMVHPSRVLDDRQLAALPAIEPLYGLTEGLSPKLVHKSAVNAVARVPVLPEWLDGPQLAQQGWPTFRGALDILHSPETPADIADNSPALARLAYDELLASQLALVLIRAGNRNAGGRITKGDGALHQKIIAALPYSLTGAQQQALTDITRDLASPDRMLRLLQGDVGSGKTIVGLLSMAVAVEAGRQAAMMAPTEILARQHLERIAPLCATAGITVALLTGRDRSSERARTLAGLADGSIDIVIGTHALFQEAVVFRDLAVAVVDEQHRFGVHQRLALSRKGDGVDLLVMTATPIPRTLVLTFFGDMDVSSLREKPAGRLPIDTRLVSLDRLEETIGAIGRAIAKGARVYWVCPLVSESEFIDVAAAEERYATLSQFFPGRVGLVHGKLPGPEKDAAVLSFQRGETDILVATTVIEVGVDVPDATIMVIEHAERFGLAQLHQLRGRVGRGAARSSCLLLYKAPLGPVSEARLKIMRETEDGFRIAEEDLRLRGEGEVLGTRQSGTPGFRIARLEIHAGLLATARDDAELILRLDPELKSARGQALRVLLYLFERDAAFRLLDAG
jgi:ATP-dependent DNA helicase RecG